MDRQLYDYFMRWLGLHDEWQKMLVNGAYAPRRTDGQMLNGVRNRMLFLLQRIGEDGYTLEIMLKEAEVNGFEIDACVRELPPEMDVKYMHEDANEIRQRAKDALKLYESLDDYQYLQENIESFCAYSDEKIWRRIKAGMSFVSGLSWAIHFDHLPEMQKFSDVVYYSDQLRRTREFLSMCIERIQPFHDDVEDKKIV